MPPRSRTFEETQHRRDLGQRIRQLRIDLGWSQEELAHRADLHRTYVVGVERGQRNVSVDVLAQIAKALGVGISSLFHPE